MKEELIEIIKTLFIPEIEKIGLKISAIEGEISGIKTAMDEMSHRISDINTHIMGLDGRINKIEIRLDKTNARLDETNKEIGRLYSVIVRREEHEDIKFEVKRLRNDVDNLIKKIAV